MIASAVSGTNNTFPEWLRAPNAHPQRTTATTVVCTRVQQVDTAGRYGKGNNNCTEETIVSYERRPHVGERSQNYKSTYNERPEDFS